jgi:hypothetical protein
MARWYGGRMANPLLATIVLCVGLSATAPETYPDHLSEKATSVLVVATIEPGGVLPPLEHCLRTPCLDPAPIWFRARVSARSDDVPPGGEIAVATISHYGLNHVGYFAGKTMLLGLRTDTRSFVMPRYAWGQMARHVSGEWYLLRDSFPVPWLPCNSDDLRVELAPEDFPEGLTLPVEAGFGLDPAADAHNFHTVDEQWIPRFGIPFSALARHLQATVASGGKPDCRPPGW